MYLKYSTDRKSTINSILYSIFLCFIFFYLANINLCINTTPKKVSGRNREASTNHILVVSTLDGGLTALNLAAGGKTLWRQEAGSDGPLLSQSLSRLEFSDAGISYRLVPSLEGGIFRLDSQGLRSLPLNADSLLAASFRLADDSVAVGGKEQRVRLLDVREGRLLYDCDGRGGCHKMAETASPSENNSGVLMMRRQTSTVRALHIRSGQERWNFSVGHLELLFLPCGEGTNANRGRPSGQNRFPYTERAAEHCRGREAAGGSKPALETAEDLEEVILSFDVPRGTVTGQGTKDAASFMSPWSTELSSPICKAWEIRGSQLREISVFEMKKPIKRAGSHESKTKDTSPLIYFGADASRQQFYVQVEKPGATGGFPHPHDVLSPHKTLHARWKHYVGSSPSRTPLIHAQIEGKAPTATTPKLHGSSSALALRESGVPYPFDEGYYVVGELQPAEPERHEQHGEHTQEEEDLWGLNVIIQNGTLWHWWKQVLVIALFFSVVTHLFIVKLVYRWSPTVDKRVTGSDSITSGLGDSGETLVLQPGSSDRGSASLGADEEDNASGVSATPSATEMFVSDYQTRFLHLSCLGRGGFGVVFEARNKMDDLHYAVKRICVKNSQRAKERILREVKALARLDHPGIVRYYQAWFETPPLGWQEDHDRVLLCASGTSNSDAPPDTEQDTEQLVSITSEEIAELPVTKPFPEPLGIRYRGFTLDRWTGGGGDGHSHSSSGVSGDSSSDELPFTQYAPPVQRQVSDSVDIVFEDSKPRPAETPSVSDSPAAAALTSAESATSSVPTAAPKLYLYIQMQLCQRASLREWLAKHTLSRNREDMLDIFLQIVNAVDYVHGCDLIHRDLKPSNIFFATDGSVRVGDFGLVTAIEEGKERQQQMMESQNPRDLRHTARVGTELYMSPEQQSGRAYDQKVDIFSLGLILVELLYPFGTENERGRVLADAKKLHLPERFVRELKKESDLVLQLLCEEPAKRPSSKEVLENPLLVSAQTGRSAREQQARQRHRSISNCSSGSSTTAKK